MWIIVYRGVWNKCSCFRNCCLLSAIVVTYRSLQFCYVFDSISESVAALNYEKSAVLHRGAVSDLSVSNGHSPSSHSAPGLHTGIGRTVEKDSTVKPPSALSANIDSSVQTIIEKMHNGLEVYARLIICPSFFLVYSTNFLIYACIHIRKTEP